MAPDVLNIQRSAAVGVAVASTSALQQLSGLLLTVVQQLCTAVLVGVATAISHWLISHLLEKKKAS